ncbi:hypothetical protein AAG570_007101 [Ranatra chinensis]|uniref:C2H2-type domain-containing protein n=1 Tax=Ranatra chinensis TaxID=642074 RepID=A0ABD0YIQ9_9HEMI
MDEDRGIQVAGEVKRREDSRETSGTTSGHDRVLISVDVDPTAFQVVQDSLERRHNYCCDVCGLETLRRRLLVDHIRNDHGTCGPSSVGRRRRRERPQRPANKVRVRNGNYAKQAYINRLSAALHGGGFDGSTTHRACPEATVSSACMVDLRDACGKTER